MKSQADARLNFEEMTEGLAGATVEVLRADLEQDFVTKAEPELLLAFIKLDRSSGSGKYLVLLLACYLVVGQGFRVGQVPGPALGLPWVAIRWWLCRCSGSGMYLVLHPPGR